jgi:hypothetical protein
MHGSCSTHVGNEKWIYNFTCKASGEDFGDLCVDCKAILQWILKKAEYESVNSVHVTWEGVQW